MTFSGPEIVSRFPVGYYALHPNVSLNFQMNRFWNWVGDQQMLDELQEAGTRIANYDDWARVMSDLSDKSQDAGRPPAAYYAKMAIFFLDPSGARVKPAFQRCLDNVLGENGVTPENHHLVPTGRRSCRPIGSPPRSRAGGWSSSAATAATFWNGCPWRSRCATPDWTP